MIKFPKPSKNILQKIEPKLMKDTYKKVHIYLFDFDIVLGKGSFSTVYKGINLQTNQQVAIKVITMQSITNPKMRQLLTHQIDILMKIKHQNLIKCFQVLSSSKHTYVIMEICTHDLESVLKYIQQQKKIKENKNHALMANNSILPNKYGDCVVQSITFKQNQTNDENCFDKVLSTKSLDVDSNCSSQKGETLPQQKFYPFIKQIFNGLLYLSDLNIIHRDLKLSNIFIKDGICKIGDFGFCTKIPSNQIQIRDTCCIGSPLYMAPQSYLKNIYNRKTDIWSFGIIIFELLFGNPPLHQCQSHEILRRQILKPINWRKYPNISSQLQQFLQGCLQVQFSKRYSVLEISQSRFFKKINKNEQINLMNQNYSITGINQKNFSQFNRNSNQKNQAFNLENFIFQNYSTIQKKDSIFERPKSIDKPCDTERFQLKHNRSCLALRSNTKNQTCNFGSLNEQYKKYEGDGQRNSNYNTNTSTFQSHTHKSSFKSTDFYRQMPKLQDKMPNYSRFYATADNFNFIKTQITPCADQKKSISRKLQTQKSSYSPRHYQKSYKAEELKRQKSPAMVKYEEAKKSYEKFLNERKSTDNLLKNNNFINISADKFSNTFTGYSHNYNNKEEKHERKSNLNSNGTKVLKTQNSKQNGQNGQNIYKIKQSSKNVESIKNININDNNRMKINDNNRAKRYITEQQKNSQTQSKVHKQKWSQFKTWKQNCQNINTEKLQLKNNLLELKKVNLEPEQERPLYQIKKDILFNPYRMEKEKQNYEYKQFNRTKLQTNGSFLFQTKTKSPLKNENNSSLTHNYSCINLKKQNLNDNQSSLNKFKPKVGQTIKNNEQSQSKFKQKLLIGQINYRDCIQVIHFCRLLYKISFFVENDQSITVLNYSIGILEDLWSKCRNFQLKYQYKNKKIDAKQAIQMDCLRSLTAINQKECCQKSSEKGQTGTKGQKLNRIINQYIKKYVHRKEALKKLSECNAILENITNTTNLKPKDRSRKSQTLSLSLTNLHFLLKKLYLQKNNKTNSKNSFTNFLNKRNSREQCKTSQSFFIKQPVKQQSEYTISQYQHICYLKMGELFCKSMIQCNSQKSFQKLINQMDLTFPDESQCKSVIQALIESKGSMNKTQCQYNIFLKNIIQELRDR